MFLNASILSGLGLIYSESETRRKLQRYSYYFSTFVFINVVLLLRNSQMYEKLFQADIIYKMRTLYSQNVEMEIQIFKLLLILPFRQLKHFMVWTWRCLLQEVPFKLQGTFTYTSISSVVLQAKIKRFFEKECVL